MEKPEIIEQINHALCQMAYCGTDTKKSETLCPCCYRKVQDTLQGLREALVNEVNKS